MEKVVSGRPFDVIILLDGKSKKRDAYKDMFTPLSERFQADEDDENYRLVEINEVSNKTFVFVHQFIYSGDISVPDHVEDLFEIYGAACYLDLPDLRWLTTYYICRIYLDVKKMGSLIRFTESQENDLLKHLCILFMIDNHEAMCYVKEYESLIERVIPEIRIWLNVFQ